MNIKFKITIGLLAAAIAFSILEWTSFRQERAVGTITDRQAKSGLTLITTLYNCHKGGGQEPTDRNRRGLGTDLISALSKQKIQARKAHISIGELAERNAILILRDNGDWTLVTRTSGVSYSIYDHPYPPRKVLFEELKTIFPPKFDCIYVSTLISEGIDSPRIVFNEVSHEEKTPIRRGTVLKLDFTYRNCGKTPLAITSLRGSCSCVASTASKEPIAPGQSGNISVQIDTTKKTGRLLESVVCATNDLHVPEFSLRVSGTILDQIDIKPLDVSVGGLPEGQPIEATVYIRFPADQQMVDPVISKSSSKCEFAVISRENHQLVTKLSFLPKQIGDFKETVTISVQNNSFDVNVSGLVKMREDVDPKAIVLGTVRPKEYIEKVLTIHNGSVSDFDFSISPPVDWIVGVTPIADRNQVQIRVYPDHPSTYVSASIEMRKHGSEKSTLYIPIIGKFSEK